MKKQISNRLGLAHVRDTIQQFALEKITYVQAMQDLGVGKTRLYELRSDFSFARNALSVRGIGVRTPRIARGCPAESFGMI